MIPSPPPLPPTNTSDTSLNDSIRGWKSLQSLYNDLTKTLNELADTGSKSIDKVRTNVRRESFWREVAEVGGFHFSLCDRRYLVRLGLSVLFFLSTGYLNSVSSVAAGYRTPNVRLLSLYPNQRGEHHESESRTLPDLGHDLVTMTSRVVLGTDYIDFFELPDMFVACFIPITLLFVLLHPRRLMIFRRVFAIFGLLNLMRSFTVIITSLPDASPNCTAQFDDLDGVGQYKTRPMWPGVLVRAFKVMTEPGEHITCGDCVFSGHSVFLLICACTFHEYCRVDQMPLFGRTFTKLIRFLAWFSCSLGLLCIVGTKLHYTLDVAISIYLTISIWSDYHRRCHFVVMQVTHPELVSLIHPHKSKWQNFIADCFEWLEAEEVIRADKQAWLAFESRLSEWSLALKTSQREEATKKNE